MPAEDIKEGDVYVQDVTGRTAQNRETGEDFTVYDVKGADGEVYSAFQWDDLFEEGNYLHLIWRDRPVRLRTGKVRIYHNILVVSLAEEEPPPKPKAKPAPVAAKPASATISPQIKEAYKVAVTKIAAGQPKKLELRDIIISRQVALKAANERGLKRMELGGLGNLDIVLVEAHHMSRFIETGLPRIVDFTEKEDLEGEVVV